MAFVYILFSEQKNRNYIGSCKDLEKRIKLHQDKSFSNSFTSNHSDWKLKFVISDLEYDQARKIEAHIKRMKSKIYIENLILYPEMVSKLKAKYDSSFR